MYVSIYLCMYLSREQCKFGPREQVNQITAWLDGSNVYGSSFEESTDLRMLRRGRMRVANVQGKI